MLVCTAYNIHMYLLVVANFLVKETLPIINLGALEVARFTLVVCSFVRHNVCMYVTKQLQVFYNNTISYIITSLSNYDASSVQNACKSAELAIVCLGNGGVYCMVSCFSVYIIFFCSM